MGSAMSGFFVRRNGNGEMNIFVQSTDCENYALEVDSSNTIQDVLVSILPIRQLARAKPKLYFNGHLLKKAKSLANYGIQDGSILHLEYTFSGRCSANASERPNILSRRKKIIITDQPLAIWEKEHNKVFLGLLIEQIQIGGRDVPYFEKDSWCDIVLAKFNESTGLKYRYEHLYERFNFYAREYQIVNRIRHHSEFSWDHQRQVVVATNADWNEYIKGDPDARLYRRRSVPYIDLLEIVFANKEVSEIVARLLAAKTDDETMEDCERVYAI